ncbi:MAG: hypothetical protein AMXMBFR84_14570 [Candidatus Hydrogenedentota bacterium]
MASIDGIAATATALKSAEFSASYQIAALKKQIETVDKAGAAALKLIQTAMSLDPQVGQNINALV